MISLCGLLFVITFFMLLPIVDGTYTLRSVYAFKVARGHKSIPMFFSTYFKSYLIKGELLHCFKEYDYFVDAAAQQIIQTVLDSEVHYNLIRLYEEMNFIEIPHFPYDYDWLRVYHSTIEIFTDNHSFDSREKHVFSIRTHNMFKQLHKMIVEDKDKK